MGYCETLRMLGAPETRNALILNEIGVLLQGLGRLSTEFVAQGDSFPHHLVLRRLTRGHDPHLGGEISAGAAILRVLEACVLDAGAPVAEALRRRVEGSRVRAHSAAQPFPLELESLLDEVGGELGVQDPSGFERVAMLARTVCSDFQWQVQQEQALEALRPPFVAVGGLLEGLDELPSVANLVEMQGRTWHPQELLPPEVRLLRTIQASLNLPKSASLSLGANTLYQVRQLFCAVVANQLLEINNIRKDGPGDLGSWFWRSRLFASSDEGLAALKLLEDGIPVNGEERDAVLWLGLRAITKWAYGKVLLRDEEGKVHTSLWEQNRLLCALYKASLAQALVEGRWPQGDGPRWRLLKVGLRRPTAHAPMEIKGLLELEYPLGNEVYRGSREMVFSFPDLGEETVEHLLRALAEEMGQLLGGGNVELSTERVLDVAHLSRPESGI